MCPTSQTLVETNGKLQIGGSCPPLLQWNYTRVLLSPTTTH